MRRQTMIGLVVGTALSAALCLPLAAQTGATQAPAAQPAGDTGQSAQAPAAQSAQPAVTGNAAAASENGTAQPDQPLAQPPREGFWGRVNPFARKKYVNKQLTPIRDRVNELDSLTNKNAQDIQALDQRSQAAIAQARSQAEQATQTADAAQQAVQQDADQANQLNQRYDATNKNLQSVDQYQVAQTAELHFNRGAAKLDSDAQQQLDSFLQGLDNEKGYVVEVTAYSPLRGQAGVDNSQRLADAVVRDLVLNHNVPLYRIYTMGMGNAPAPEAGTTPAGNAGEPAAGMTPAAAPTGPTNRATSGGTVEVRILRNSLNTAPNGGQ